MFHWMIIYWYDTNTWCLIFVTSTLIQEMALLQAIIWSNLVIAITKDMIPKSHDGRMSSATALVKSNHHFHGNHWLHDVVVCTITLCSMAAIRHTGHIIILAPFLYKGVVLSVSEIPLWRSHERISYIYSHIKTVTSMIKCAVQLLIPETTMIISAYPFQV